MECMCFEVKNGDGPRVVVGQEKGGDRGVDHIGSGVNAAFETTDVVPELDFNFLHQTLHKRK
jgi:hypothetical protein